MSDRSLSVIVLVLLTDFVLGSVSAIGLVMLVIDCAILRRLLLPLPPKLLIRLKKRLVLLPVEVAVAASSLAAELIVRVAVSGRRLEGDGEDLGVNGTLGQKVVRHYVQIC